jgi:hypothetical protein
MLDDTPIVNKKLDSHASYMTNRAVNLFKMQIDVLALQAANSLHYNHINSFYNAVEVWYLSLKDLMKDTDEKNYRTQIENIRKMYKALQEKINTDGRFRTRRSLQLLFNLAQEFYSLIISGMQEYQYFFRLSNISHKGLGKIHFISDSIFKTGAKKDDRAKEKEIN